MGEMAEDLIDGSCCQICGEYFTEDHGYPVVCKECWRAMSKKERQEAMSSGLQVATHPTV